MKREEKEKIIFNWLQNDPRLSIYAEIYKGAVVLLDNKIPGYINFVAHAGRELMNGLPQTVKGIKRQQVQYKYLVKNIEKQWDCNWKSKSKKIPSKSDFDEGKIIRDDSDNGHFIPNDLCDQITNLVEEHREGCTRSKESDELFFTTFLDYKDKKNISKEFLEEWNKAKKYFLKRTHLREKAFDRSVSFEIKKHFEILNEFLYIAANGEYKRKMEEINEILEATNN